MKFLFTFLLIMIYSPPSFSEVEIRDFFLDEVQGIPDMVKTRDHIYSVTKSPGDNACRDVIEEEEEEEEEEIEVEELN